MARPATAAAASPMRSPAAGLEADVVGRRPPPRRGQDAVAANRVTARTLDDAPAGRLLRRGHLQYGRTHPRPYPGAMMVAEQPVSSHVERELRAYLTCGILCFGFGRARCASCGQGFVVAFSCKGRGVCPSCNGRRMAQSAAHLVDRVIPPVPVRQWVISVPKRLRCFLADRPSAARSSWTGSPISSRRRGSTGIATTGCLPRITNSGEPSRHSPSGTSASGEMPRPVGMRSADMRRAEIPTATAATHAPNRAPVARPPTGASSCRSTTTGQSFRDG